MNSVARFNQRGGMHISADVSDAQERRNIKERVERMMSMTEEEQYAKFKEQRETTRRFVANMQNREVTEEPEDVTRSAFLADKARLLQQYENVIKQELADRKAQDS